MFTIYRKSVGGRRHDTYYRNWDNAKRELNESMKSALDHIGGTITRTIDRFNAEKGFYEYQVEATLSTGEKCIWALIDGYFSD